VRAHASVRAPSLAPPRRRLFADDWLTGWMKAAGAFDGLPRPK
jgi:hypothetical protein